MKIGFLKIGARLAFGRNDTSAGNGEARDLMVALSNAGAEVHVITKILDGDDLVPQFKFHHIQDVVGKKLDLDALIVMNGNLNFFGGADAPEQIANYDIINRFEGKVFYVLCDPALALKQAWPSISGKEWAPRYEQKNIEIIRDDIVYISQSYNLDVVRKKILDKVKNIMIQPKNLIYFPLHFSPAVTKEALPFNENPTWDLSYGGTQRGGRRDAKLAKFFYGHDENIRVELFGKIAHDKFDEKYVTAAGRQPQFGKAIRHADVQARMNDSIATVTIGDKLYEELNIVSQRVTEAIWAGTVNFIDADFDPKRLIFGDRDPELSKFLYVKDRAELSKKIIYLKNNEKARRHIFDSQRVAYGYDGNKFGTDLLSLIKNHGKTI